MSVFICNAQTAKGVGVSSISLQPKVMRYIDSTTNAVCYMVITPTTSTAFSSDGHLYHQFSTGDNVSISCVKLDKTVPGKK